MVEAVFKNEMMKSPPWADQTRKAKSAFVECSVSVFPSPALAPMPVHDKSSARALFLFSSKARPSVILPASNSQPHCPLYVNCCGENTHSQSLSLQHRFTCKLNRSALHSYSIIRFNLNVRFSGGKKKASQCASQDIRIPC